VILIGIKLNDCGVVRCSFHEIENKKRFLVSMLTIFIKNLVQTPIKIGICTYCEEGFE
jgi:hypothetical protein